MMIDEQMGVDLLDEIGRILDDPHVRRCAHCGKQGTARQLTAHLDESDDCLVADQPLVEGD